MIYLGKKFIIIISQSKLKDKQPSRLYHDFHSIKWLNNRKKQDMVRSINNLIQYNDANDNRSLSTSNLSVAISPQEINDDQNNNKLLFGIFLFECYLFKKESITTNMSIEIRTELI